jgi:hypothetical protein
VRACCSQQHPTEVSHHSLVCVDAVLQDGKPHAIQLHGDLSYADDYQASAAMCASQQRSTMLQCCSNCP